MNQKMFLAKFYLFSVLARFDWLACLMAWLMSNLSRARASYTNINYFYSLPPKFDETTNFVTFSFLDNAIFLLAEFCEFF